MKLKYVLPLFLFFHISHLTAQIAKEISRINADSLASILPDLTGTEKIDALNKIAFGLFGEFPDSCIAISLNTISSAEELEYPKGIADGYFNLGNGYYMKDSLKTAVVHYLKALRIYEDQPPSREMGLLLGVLSALNLSAGRFNNAVNYQKKTVDLFNQLSLFHYEVIAFNRLANCFWYDESKSSKWDSAYYYHQKALDLLKTYPDNELFAETYMLMSGVAIMWGNRDPNDQESRRLVIDLAYKSLAYYKLTDSRDRIWRLYNYPYIKYHLAVGLTNIGSADSTRKAIEYLYQLLDISLANDTIFYDVILKTYYVLALEKYRSKDYQESIALNKLAVSKAEERKAIFPDRVYKKTYPFSLISMKWDYRVALGRWPYNLLYYAYIKIGDYKNALKYYKLKAEANNEVYFKDNEVLLAMLEAESEDEKIEQQMARLERDNQINALKANQSRYINIGLGSAFVVLLIIGMLFFRQNKLKNEQKNTLLEQKLLRLQMNPHFIFNALSGIHSLMNPKDVNKASDYLGHFSRLLRSSLESSREDYILLEDEIGSIRNYLELQQLRYEKKFDYEIDVDNDIDIESAIIPPMLIQPFIENALEHGIKHKQGKGNLQIRFRLEGKKISCEIEDDGIGREKAWEVEYAKKGKQKSLATEIIRDRIAILNKKLKQKISLDITDLRSEANEAIGTVVRLDLPYLLD